MAKRNLKLNPDDVNLDGLSAVSILDRFLAEFGIPPLHKTKQVQSIIVQWVTTLAFKEFITLVVNGLVEESGMGDKLKFRNILDQKMLRDDLDRGFANMINAKLGTSLTGIQGMTKDEILQELGGVFAQRINAEAGTSITNIFPVARLRSELGTAVIDQLDAATVNTGSIITRDKVKQLKDKVAAGLSAYVPPNAPLGSISDARRSANRAAQKKYRQTHKAVWVAR
jgi:hypothetical protein